MAEIGYFLSSEELGPRAMLRFARAGEEAGFRSLFVSDHYHPWLDSQGQSPFVWSVIGAVAAATDLAVTSGVTCPTMRVHPAVLAQAAATSQLLLEGRFSFGIGTGENLNEHILADRWPPAATRREMLEEAVSVLRGLWRGELFSHHGRYYEVENARIYSLPDRPPPVLVSAFGPESAALAARIGDGLVCTQPDGEVLRHFREAGGTGRAVAATKVCWAPEEAEARRLSHHLWATEALPGQLNQELALPAHFEEAAGLVTEDMVAERIPCGPDPERHAAALRAYLEAGYDEVYVSQVGQDQAGFLSFFFKEVEPRLGA